ncbi:uncharacterized protein [Dermacentor andersoni]|uniref:uncharacterized protein n=1 Tax=Dermacentor andersoni TaxID=34620 RepID=UPI002155984C|nr:uncharacterized protein LOC126517802 [Dermacentor andersoni]
MSAPSISTSSPIASSLLPLLLWSVHGTTCMTVGEPSPTGSERGEHVRHGSQEPQLVIQLLEYVTSSYEIEQPPPFVVTNTTKMTLSHAVKSVNPFLLVALVVTALLVLLLGFAYVTRKSDTEDPDSPAGRQQQRDASAASRQNGAFEQDTEGTDACPAQPPSYDDVVKVPWTIWAATQQGVFTQGSGATPPPSYEDARRTFPFPECAQ